MTATTQFKILKILEPVLGTEKATEFTERIEEVVNTKVQNETKMLATKTIYIKRRLPKKKIRIN